MKSLHLNSLINVYITVSLAQFINLSLECHKEGSKPEIFPFSGCRLPYFCIIFGRRHDEKLINYFTTRHDWILFGLWGSVLNLQNIGLITSRMASALFSTETNMQTNTIQTWIVGTRWLIFSHIYMQNVACTISRPYCDISTGFPQGLIVSCWVWFHRRPYSPEVFSYLTARFINKLSTFV